MLQTQCETGNGDERRFWTTCRTGSDWIGLDRLGSGEPDLFREGQGSGDPQQFLLGKALYNPRERFTALILPQLNRHSLQSLQSLVRQADGYFPHATSVVLGWPTGPVAFAASCHG